MRRFPLGCISGPLLVALALLVLACASGPQTRFYRLMHPHELSVGEPVSSAEEQVVGVGPIIVPAYLDRPQIVSSAGGHEIQLAESHQWVQPLRDAVEWFLVEDLRRRVTGGRVVAHPWRRSEQVERQVEIELIRFEGRPGGECLVQARWLIRRTGGDVSQQLTEIREPSAGNDWEGVVSGLSRALERLGEEVSARLNASSAP